MRLRHSSGGGMPSTRNAQNLYMHLKITSVVREKNRDFRRQLSKHAPVFGPFVKNTSLLSFLENTGGFHAFKRKYRDWKCKSSILQIDDVKFTDFTKKMYRQYLY